MHSKGTASYVLGALIALFSCSLGSCGGAATMPPALPQATLSPTSLTFPDENAGSTSDAQAVSLTNSGSGSLQISQITVSANFNEIDDCPSILAPAAKCTISVTFAPAATGNLTGSLSVTDSATGSPHAASLSGNGVTSGPTQSVLTGTCFGVRQNQANKCALVGDSTSCPAGTVAAQPTDIGGCLPPASALVDTSRTCQGKTADGAQVNGYCVAAFE
jgi:Abnormal spindle-like microcephaly-assoc'd, ASPM-SPD-2-Hydin